MVFARSGRLALARAALACAALAGMGCGEGAAPAAPAAPAAQEVAAVSTPLRSPKPGERVRQPELDAYCDDDHAVAFYYHGGHAMTRVARKDRCAPLFVTECEAEGRCYPPRDQEPGMWCCAPRDGERPTIQHATR